MNMHAKGLVKLPHFSRSKRVSICVLLFFFSSYLCSQPPTSFAGNHQSNMWRFEFRIHAFLLSCEEDTCMTVLKPHRKPGLCLIVVVIVHCCLSYTAELFHQLSQALEVLTDAAARVRPQSKLTRHTHTLINLDCSEVWSPNNDMLMTHFIVFTLIVYFSSSTHYKDALCCLQKYKDSQPKWYCCPVVSIWPLIIAAQMWY